MLNLNFLICFLSGEPARQPLSGAPTQHLGGGQRGGMFCDADDSGFVVFGGGEGHVKGARFGGDESKVRGRRRV